MAWILIILLIFLGGLIAPFGDLLGTKIGKSRFSILKLRPKKTATIITVITGGFISSISIGANVVHEYYLTGLVEKLPSAILAGFLMIIYVLSFFSGLLLDVIKKIRFEIGNNKSKFSLFILSKKKVIWIDKNIFLLTSIFKFESVEYKEKIVNETKNSMNLPKS